MENIGNNGRFMAHGGSTLGSADAHGWLFRRCVDFLEHFKGEQKHEANFEVESAIEKSLKGLEHNFTRDSFEFNNPLETWMDTSFGNDDRNGIRIEIQALRLNIYKLISELSQNPKYKVMENILQMKTRTSFWNGKNIFDGSNDPTQRPNIFIAHYAYPGLLLQDEWQEGFENVLASLWLNWGGLATIDKKNPLFTDTYQGEGNKSYHRGDSWFWLNNLAGICMQKVNKNKFDGFVKKILAASTEEILWKNCIGCHAEVSSAKELSSFGCFNQAWSNAMFMELVEEVY